MMRRFKVVTFGTALLLVFSAPTYVLDARAGAQSDCEARANAASERCTQSAKPDEARLASCDAVLTDTMGRCAHLGQAASDAARDPRIDDIRKYGRYCQSLTGQELAVCRRCVDVTKANEGDQGRERIQKYRTVSACSARMTAETEEMKALMTKMSKWQPRGYKDAGDGLEALSDADLDTVIPALRNGMQRMSEIGIDLGGTALPADKIEESVTQVQGFLTKELGCRADKKCMGVRAARKAEELFFASVAGPLCEADKNRELAQADMNRERSNPSGIVDMNVLHEAGAAVQADKDQIKALTPAYVATRHHAFGGWRSECQ